MTTVLFEASGLCKAFSRRPALHEVSFSIAPGEIVGFVGPNGAGKSTTLRIACGLLRPDAARSAGRLLRAPEPRESTSVAWASSSSPRDTGPR